MEREGGGARQPPPILLSFPPSFAPPPLPLLFFSPCCLSWRKWQVRVEQEVRHVHLVRRSVWLPSEGAHADAGVLTWRLRTPPDQRFSTSLLQVQADYQ